LPYPSPYEKSRDRETKIAIGITLFITAVILGIIITAI